MTPRKLSESDKQNILHLYRHPGETTSTLAERYGVSNTTISRVLKSLLPEQEYEALVQQRRAARPQAGFAEFAAELAFEPEASFVDEPVEAREAAQPTSSVTAAEVVTPVESLETVEAVEVAAGMGEESAEVSEAAIAPVASPIETIETAAVEAAAEEAEPIETAVEATAEAVAAPTPKSIAPPIKRRQRKRSSAADEMVSTEPTSEAPEVVESQLQLLDVTPAAPEAEKKSPKAPPIVKAAISSPIDEVGAGITREILSEDLQARAADLIGLEDEDDLDDDDLNDDLDDLDDDLNDLDDEDEDDDEGDPDDSDSFMGSHLPTKAFVRVLPLAEAAIPKTFYLVVDRMAELITRPLREFGDLGQIPSEDIQARTLPIFDNHRVARRFSKRNQRVIKVPDGRMLPKVSTYLQAKGITRLLIDGQVYSL